jgi:C4-dicarboxylate-specific signal transduction histidine kinase
MSPDTDQLAEAAHYALLRRLAYALRHQVARHLQAIGLMAEVLERKLESPSPDIASAHERLAKVNTQARAAVQSALEIITWLAPDPAKLVTVDTGVADCVELLRTHLSFRGFALRSEAGGIDVEVAQSAIRSLLPAVLLAMTDSGASPAEIVVTPHRGERAVRLSIQLRPTAGSPGFSGELHYRSLAWPDVEALATWQGVVFQREGDEATLTFAA